MAKASDQEIEFHNLILIGDGTALSRLYNLYSEVVAAHLEINFPKLAEANSPYFYEAINEAFLNYYKNPASFDPGKKSLLGFLKMAAQGDLINLLEKEKHYIEGKKKFTQDVELYENFWNSIPADGVTAESQAISEEVIQQVKDLLSKYFRNNTDMEIATLVIQKVRETEKFADILGISDQPVTHQQEEVKRHKDRVQKVLKRKKLIEQLNRIIL